jgi:hypothetical protein
MTLTVTMNCDIKVVFSLGTFMVEELTLREECRLEGFQEKGAEGGIGT